MLIRGYTHFSITSAGVRNDLLCDRNWCVSFKFDADVRELFPYINGTIEKARYQLRPLHVRFEFQEALCTVYPEEVLAVPFKGRDHALEFIEDLIVFLNNLFNRRRELRPDYRYHRQPVSVLEIIKALPRTNCRKCGHPTDRKSVV